MDKADFDALVKMVLEIETKLAELNFKTQMAGYALIQLREHLQAQAAKDKPCES